MARLSTYHDYCKWNHILNEDTQLPQLTPIETILHRAYIVSDSEKIPNKQTTTSQPEGQHSMWIMFAMD